MTIRESRSAANASANVDAATVVSFGDEWSHFDQSALSKAELARAFSVYFKIFPWDALPDDAEGFDMGCGSGRWVQFVAPRVGTLNCIDASAEALSVAPRTLADHDNIRFFHATANAAPLPKASQDFGYSVGVLHHIPDTEAALQACVDLLKPGAPLLVYLYYRFDGRVPGGGVTRAEQAASERAFHSAVASERLAVVIDDSSVGWVANMQPEPRNHR